MSELLVLRRPRPPAIVPPLLSFTAGFIDSFTVLAVRAVRGAGHR